MNTLRRTAVCGGDSSREERALVQIFCEARQGTRPWQRVTLADISPSGFRVVRLPGCNPHAPVRIRIPGVQILSARVCWRDGNTIGCEFDQPLHVAVFEHLIRNAGGSPQPVSL